MTNCRQIIFRLRQIIFRLQQIIFRLRQIIFSIDRSKTLDIISLFIIFFYKKLAYYSLCTFLILFLFVSSTLRVIVMCNIIIQCLTCLLFTHKRARWCALFFRTYLYNRIPKMWYSSKELSNRQTKSYQVIPETICEYSDVMTQEHFDVATFCR